MNGTSASISYQNSRLMVSGDLSFLTVMKLWNESLPLLSQCTNLDFDLSNVISSNSAGLALLLEWIKYAKRVNKPVAFHYLPAQLNSIIAVAGLKQILSNS